MKSNPLKNFVGHLRPRSGQENSHSVENTSISGLWKYHNRRRVNCLFIVILDRDWPHFLNSKSFLSESIFRSIWQKDNLGTRESVCGSSAVFAPIRPRWVRLISPPDMKNKTKRNKKGENVKKHPFSHQVGEDYLSASSHGKLKKSIQLKKKTIYDQGDHRVKNRKKVM